MLHLNAQSTFVETIASTSTCFERIPSLETKDPRISPPPLPAAAPARPSIPQSATCCTTDRETERQAFPIDPAGHIYTSYDDVEPSILRCRRSSLLVPGGVSVQPLLANIWTFVWHHTLDHPHRRFLGSALRSRFVVPE